MNKNYIIMALYGVGMMISCYKLGNIQASLNVHDYEEVSASIRLACTGMIDNDPIDEVKNDIESYYWIRKVMERK